MSQHAPAFASRAQGPGTRRRPGGDAASVKVVETYPRSIYTDYLNLLRVNGAWHIVHKICTSRSRQSP